jgi:hypothetical protein
MAAAELAAAPAELLVTAVQPARAEQVVPVEPLG